MQQLTETVLSYTLRSYFWLTDMEFGRYVRICTDLAGDAQLKFGVGKREKRKTQLI